MIAVSVPYGPLEPLDLSGAWMLLGIGLLTAILAAITLAASDK